MNYMPPHLANTPSRLEALKKVGAQLEWLEGRAHTKKMRRALKRMERARKRALRELGH
jgi:acyl carrier protein phosphodiesterase